MWLWLIRCRSRPRPLRIFRRGSRQCGRFFPCARGAIGTTATLWRLPVGRSADSPSNAGNPLRGRRDHGTAPGIYLPFFSFFFFRLSFGLSCAFFCCSFLPLSLFPLSPISVSPSFGPTLLKGRLPGSAGEPFRRYCTRVRQPHARSIRVIRMLGPNDARLHQELHTKQSSVSAV